MIDKQSMDKYYQQRIPDEVKPLYAELGPFNVYAEPPVFQLKDWRNSEGDKFVLFLNNLLND